MNKTEAHEEALAMLALIKFGEQQFEQGEHMLADDVFAELRRKKGIGA